MILCRCYLHLSIRWGTLRGTKLIIALNFGNEIRQLDRSVLVLPREPKLFYPSLFICMNQGKIQFFLRVLLISASRVIIQPEPAITASGGLFGGLSFAPKIQVPRFDSISVNNDRSMPHAAF